MSYGGVCMNDIRLLIADQDSAVRSAIKKMATAQGYLFDEAADGIAALKLFRRHDYNIIILIVSAKYGEQDKLNAFELGVDDYIAKPFSAPELLARIKVFLYRSGGLNRVTPAKITFSGLFIDTISRAVYIDDSAVQLTPKEYDLLFFLSQNPNKAFSRETLLNEVWGYDFTGSDRTVDTHIKTLRENIKPYDTFIVTVWGFGYKFVT